MQFKLDCSKNDIRKVVADIPMDKNYKIGEIQFKKNVSTECLFFGKNTELIRN